MADCESNKSETKAMACVTRQAWSRICRHPALMGFCQSGTLFRTVEFRRSRASFGSAMAGFVTSLLTVVSADATRADVMAFASDGTVRTSGWTFHGRDKGRFADEIQSSAQVPDTSRQIPDRATILSAIRTTSTRHARNRVLKSVGLSTSDWHALFQALIETESAYNPSAVSPKGAYGLGQLMPETAQALGVDRQDVAQNLDGAARYLLSQLDRFKDIDLALAAYNAGPHRVVEHGGVPPFEETRTYIARLNATRARLSGSRTAATVLRVSARNPLHDAARPSLVLDLK